MTVVPVKLRPPVHSARLSALVARAEAVIYKEFEGDSNFTVEKVAKSRILKVINIEQ